MIKEHIFIDREGSIDDNKSLILVEITELADYLENTLQELNSKLTSGREIPIDVKDIIFKKFGNLFFANHPDREKQFLSSIIPKSSKQEFSVKSIAAEKLSV
jgi:hypothetical protein